MKDTADSLLRELVEVIGERPFQARDLRGPFDCVFCGGSTDDETRPVHEPGCIWPRVVIATRKPHANSGAILQQVVDEDERTSPIGLFNYAESYWCAAVVLGDANIKTPFRESPLRFLYIHAIELYLKSFLRLKGLSVRELANRKLGHNIFALGQRAAKLELHLDDEDIDVLKITEAQGAHMRSRYIKTGHITVATLDAFNRTCMSLRDSVRCELRQAGHRTRRP